MKAIYKFSILLISAGIMHSASASAQEFKTSESIRTQLKNGTVPGLKYGPESRKPAEDQPKPKQYTKGEFKNTLGDGAAQNSGGTARRSAAPKSLKTSNAKPASGSLPSDTKVPEKADKKIEVPKLPPMQEEEKKG
jgi:hypothetical protein